MIMFPLYHIISLPYFIQKKTLSGLHGKPAFKVMVIFAVVKHAPVKVKETAPVRVAMSSDLRTVQVSTYSTSPP